VLQSARVDRVSRARRLLEGGRLSRAGWIIADQAVSALGNAALAIVVARLVSPTQFGAFALAFSLYSFLIGLSQALGGQVMLIRHAADDAPSRRRAASGATGAVVIFSTATAAILATASLELAHPIRGAVLGVALFLPPLLIQDAWRSVFVSYGTPRSSFVNDLLWTVLQFGLVLLLATSGFRSASVYVVAWAAAAVPPAVLGSMQAGARPNLRQGLRFALRNRDLSLTLGAQWIALMGASQLAFVAVSAIGGVRVVGALRGAQVLLGPVNVISFAIASFAVPELVRARLSRRGLIAAAAAIGGLITVCDATWGLVLLFLPHGIGAALLGASWPAARQVLPSMIVFTCCVGLTVGCAAVFRALDRPGFILVSSAIAGPLILALSTAGVVLRGTRGAGDGFALAGILAVVPTWLLLLRATEKGRRDTVSSVA
jgi:O-antigen/teichoic acid export membrane protein